jgi:hypothetical protein
MRRTEGAGLVELNNLLRKVLESLQAHAISSEPDAQKSFWVFFSPVKITGKYGITDYFQYVQKALSMKEMMQRCNSSTYPSVAEFLADIDLIVNNARAYNNPAGPGKFGDPYLLDVAERFGAEARRLLDELGDAVIEAESIVRGDGGGVRPMADLG